MLGLRSLSCLNLTQFSCTILSGVGLFQLWNFVCRFYVYLCLYMVDVKVNVYDAL